MGYLKCRTNSWIPLLVSCVMDAFSMRQLNTVPLTGEQQAEVSRRMTLLSLYLLREPLYGGFFRPFYMFILSRVLRHIPLINFMADMFVGVFDGMHSLHFYKSGS